VIRDPNPLPRRILPAGCLIALGSVALTCLLLLLNGSLVLAILDSIPSTAPSWAKKPEFLQFLLFLLPVLMVVVQWIVIDYVRSRFRRRSLDD
jgi:uncharacterized membrane protein YhdT